MLQKYRAQINPYKERVTKSSTELWKIAQFVEKRCNYARPKRQTICKVITKEAQLSQKDRATHYVRWNLVDCYTAVRKIPFQKACNHCLHSVVNANTKANRKGQISTPVASKSLNGFRWNLEYMTMSRVRLHTQIHVELRQRGWSGRAHDMSYVGFLVSLYFYHYPHMPIGKEWIYCLLFTIFVFLVCTVTDFSTDDKASGVKFCTAVHRRPRQGISHLGHFAPPEARNRTNRPARALNYK